jgi:hypothetical protein
MKLFDESIAALVNKRWDSVTAVGLDTGGAGL